MLVHHKLVLKVEFFAHCNCQYGLVLPIPEPHRCASNNPTFNLHWALLSFFGASSRNFITFAILQVALIAVQESFTGWHYKSRIRLKFKSQIQVLIVKTISVDSYIKLRGISGPPWPACLLLMNWYLLSKKNQATNFSHSLTQFMGKTLLFVCLSQKGHLGSIYWTLCNIP